MSQVQAEQALKYNDYIHIVAGCNKKDVLDYSDGKWNSLRERAAFEMSCAMGSLDVNILTSDTYGVTGCGQKVVYKWVNFVGMVIESHSGKAEGAAPANEKPQEAPAK